MLQAAVTVEKLDLGGWAVFRAIEEIGEEGEEMDG